ncbi:hypothetical protein HMPREF9123_2031 [Neisseria bacilliformis ATCC BAA-1200]|uniref:Uncharacterized protein n=1 Tax=Neisseria bacilliformis ATCC BAA-1200 TaxID=888742 RepID=F2BE75_9NEIS|nr:hypothetical protein HMPREF9123_2031 [Neisseria bacilliformis ATCC BAA-1200]
MRWCWAGKRPSEKRFCTSAHFFNRPAVAPTAEEPPPDAVQGLFAMGL